MTMGEPFFWVVMGLSGRGRPQVAMVCEEAALPGVQEQVAEWYGRVESLPASLDDSFPDVAAAREAVDAMRLLLFGVPGSAGPGKFPGKQARLREQVTSAARALGMEGDDDES